MAITRTTAQQILDAVQELHNQEQIVTREALLDVTGLKLTIIDDRLATLVDRGDIIRKGRGVFVPAVQHPPARSISKTVMPDGMVKIEIGDKVLQLTPREDRTLAAIQSGTAAQFATIEMGYQVAQLVYGLKRQFGKLEVPEKS